MLVFMRKEGESFYIGENIEITINTIENNQVKVCVEAPKELPIIRKELLTNESHKKTKQDIFETVEKLKKRA